MNRREVDLFEITGKTIRSAKPVQELLTQLLDSSIVLMEEWEQLPDQVRATIFECTDTGALLTLLQEFALITEYQANRIEAGTIHGLILGNYRVLDRLGAGAMGVVFKAEHYRMRRQVAIKCLPLLPGQDKKLLMRFFTEMRAVAQLQHPNIVAAFDAGELAAKGQDTPTIHYFVMEYVLGEDLEQHVVNRGPLPIAKACDLGYQMASALSEAHKHNLVHRDIKPSNVRINSEEQAKLLDFGLARHFQHRHTEPGTVLGTLDYMAPEQAQDAGSVDIRADIYALGASLYWCLTAEPPFATQGSLIQAVTQRLTQTAPSIRALRPEVSIELEAVLARMMALKPEDRYATPEAVMKALVPFLKPELNDSSVNLALDNRSAHQGLVGLPNYGQGRRVLIVDDHAIVREFARVTLEAEGFQCTEAPDGEQGLGLARAEPFDLLLLDIDMPRMQGTEVLRQLREEPPRPHLKIIMVSGRATANEMATMLVAGADGYLTKPFSSVQLVGQVKASLRLKDVQDRADLLNRRLGGINSELERTLGARDSDLVHVRNALVLGLATLVKHRDGETGAHVWRLQRYSRCLAEAAAGMPVFAGQIDANFIDLIECCAPLHDIGKVGIPDHILLKPGKLTTDERLLMQTHTIIGAETLKEVAEHHGTAVVFLQMAADIARSHHEHFDGAGYPDHLSAGDIPLAARIVAIGDVYDALRSRRVYKPALSHSSTMKIMTDESAGHFDPALMQAFHRCEGKFDKIFHELAG